MSSLIEIISYPPLITVVTGVLLSYFLVNRHDRSKDKIKIKEDIILRIMEASSLHVQKLSEYTKY